MKKNICKMLTAVSIAATLFSANAAKVQAAWKSDSNGWWYTEGNSYSTGWKNIDGNWYYFYSNGYMAHDVFIGNYYVNSSGAWTNNVPQYHKYSYNECLQWAKAYFSNSHMSGLKFTTKCNQKLNSSDEYHFEFYCDGNKLDGCYVNADTQNIRSDIYD